MYTLVIADDEERICDSIQCVVDAVFPQVRTVGIFQDGSRLEDYLRAHSVDLIITDIEMPGRTGLDIARLVAQQGHSSYIIMITAYQEFDYVHQALQSHVDSFLTKPYTTKMLESEIRKGLDFLTERDSCFREQWTLYRSLLKALAEDETQEFPPAVFSLCRGRIPFSQLTCTELNFHSENCNLLDAAQKEKLTQDLQGVGECDTAKQSVFFLELRHCVLTFLVFSKDAADTAFADGVLQVIARYTGNASTGKIKSFPSFAAYRKYRWFGREMDHFFKILARNGLHQAEAHGSGFLDACSDEERRSFAEHLRTEYQAVLDDDSPESLLGCLSALANRSVGNRSSSYIVQSALNYIRAHYSEPALSLDAAANALSVSTGYLSRIFKDETGQNFSKYLQAVRMEHAKTLLKTTPLSVNAIAEKTGYSNAAYFRTAFKAYVGLTPRQYRQE